jgi:hypothetical protein
MDEYLLFNLVVITGPALPRAWRRRRFAADGSALAAASSRRSFPRLGRAGAGRHWFQRRVRVVPLLGLPLGEWLFFFRSRSPAPTRGRC